MPSRRILSVLAKHFGMPQAEFRKELQEKSGMQKLSQKEMIGKTSTLDGYTIIKPLRKFRDRNGSGIVYQVEKEDGSVGEDYVFNSEHVSRWFQ